LISRGHHYRVGGSCRLNHQLFGFILPLRFRRFGLPYDDGGALLCRIGHCLCSCLRVVEQGLHFLKRRGPKHLDAARRRRFLLFRLSDYRRRL
jgi:hypothetical protein